VRLFQKVSYLGADWQIGEFIHPDKVLLISPSKNIQDRIALEQNVKVYSSKKAEKSEA